MANTYTLISSNVLSSSAASVSWSAIPSTYTDLVLRFSARNTSTGQYAYYRFNNVATSTYSATIFYGDGVNGTSNRNTYSGNISSLGTSTDTANTFGSGEIYVPNYAGSTNKPSSNFSVNENNDTLAYIFMIADLWSSTSAINRIDFLPTAGNLAAGSSFYLYGIKNS